MRRLMDRKTGCPELPASPSPLRAAIRFAFSGNWKRGSHLNIKQTSELCGVFECLPSPADLRSMRRPFLGEERDKYLSRWRASSRTQREFSTWFPARYHSTTRYICRERWTFHAANPVCSICSLLASLRDESPFLVTRIRALRRSRDFAAGNHRCD